MIEYRQAMAGDIEAIRTFLSENGWANRSSDAARFRLMIENADRTIVAVDEQRIIGFARALCDGVSNGYIGTVAVSESERGRGIGREMVRRLIGNEPNITWVLRAGRGSEDFWKKMGFQPSEIAMECNRSV